MKRKAIMYIDESRYFILECGHTSPLFISKDVNVSRQLHRLHTGTLYRECGKCQRAENRKAQDAGAVV